MHLDKRIVKASFKDCPIPDRKLFNKSSCIVPISVGQSIHEGKKFEATIKLINTSFKDCTILIDDSVQRHTLKISYSPDELNNYQKALREGTEWLQRNQIVLDQLTIPHKILRWDDWLHSFKYKECWQMVDELYRNNELYKKAIDENIIEFLARYLTKLENKLVDYDTAFNYCLDYLKEECAVMFLWTEGKYEFELYPSGRNKAMGATYEFLIKPNYPEYLRAVALRFKKYQMAD